MTFLDRIFRREPPGAKAVMGGAYLAALQSGPLLSVIGNSYQERAAAYLRAYKCGWFYKAGSRISRDFANLEWTLSYEDGAGDNADEITAAPSTAPFESLDPLGQFLRLVERPNPYQTGRQLKQQSQIRLDFAGRTFLYAENGEGGGLPTALYGISPSRMFESKNRAGQRIGWVLDANSQNPVPFDPSEIIVIEYPGTDADPVGVVEAIYAQVPLTDLMAGHVRDVLTTGGRLAGMVSPKDRALNEDEFQDVLRAWRNVSSDPNAARRLLVFPEPMEWSSGASTPAEIGIPELALLTRDEVLTAFPLSPYLLGVPVPGGLNSAETRREERHDYWEGTQHPRVEVWEDALQQQLIPRYEEAVGRPLDLDIEEPNLDDAPTIIEKVGAYKGLVGIGFDAKEAVAAVGLDHIKWNGLPAILDPAKQLLAQQAAQQQAAQMTVMAGDSTNRDRATTQQPVAGKSAETREEIVGRELPGLHQAVLAALTDQRDRLIPLIEASLPKQKAARKALPDDWWDPKRERGAFLEALRTAYRSLARGALEVVSNTLGRTVLRSAIDPITEATLERAGIRIDEINETTRQAIVDTLTEGTGRGYSISQLVNGVPDEDFTGLRDVRLANGVPAWDPYRAEVIARTETMLAYNEAALRGYGEYGVASVQATDGDKDDECAARDGTVYALDDALNVSDHPNGTLDWIPVT